MSPDTGREHRPLHVSSQKSSCLQPAGRSTRHAVPDSRDIFGMDSCIPIETFSGALQFILQNDPGAVASVNSSTAVRTSAKSRSPSEISTSQCAPDCSNVAYAIARLLRSSG